MSEHNINDGDIKPEQFPELSWETKEAAQSLDDLFIYVTKRADKAINWYYKKRKWMRFMGYILRYAAITATAVAGIIPVLGTIYRENSLIDPAWSAIAIAIAALMVAMDKLGGFTSAWVRYVLAAQELDHIEENFRFRWEIENFKLKASLNEEEILRMIGECREFLSQVHEIIHEETEKWVMEFRTALKDVDAAAKIAAKTAKERAKMEQSGAISVEVENGSECKDAWKLRLNGGAEKLIKGKRGSVTEVSPGFVEVQAVGVINGKPVQDSKPAKILGGETTIVTLKME
ncbi:MAG: SLATT domain-containing protein [Gammaproteobacteria bacterium]|nr:SLATT domain-containing protein [Gammaproteobacteria bacterium]